MTLLINYKKNKRENLFAAFKYILRSVNFTKKSKRKLHLGFPVAGFCEIQYKNTEQSFEFNSMNAEWCKTKSWINCKNLQMIKIVNQSYEARTLAC
ncbi:hypothetical protein BpHYR1_052638 [Brachionus plicatilis]|uniref:Uncharacterized protein n=1 Tax=Brachionus plicatilis TaxID=10195 RepID=A0A3M7S9I0_BRAPC|nr:hypothetical protein BpHYR1_052638 [Brachionus plicatilis]